MLKKTLLLLSTILITFFGANAQTGFTDNFDSGTISSNWWEGSSQYSLSQSDGVLKIGVNKYAGWASYGINLPSAINVSSNPFVNIKVKTEQDITLDVYLVDAANVNKNISRRISRTDGFVNVCWDFSGVSGIDLTQITKLYFAVNGSGLSYNGNFQFDDLKVGTDAQKLSNFSGTPDLEVFHGSENNVILLRNLQNVQNIAFESTPTYITNIEYGIISAAGSMTISFDASETGGTETLTLQSTGTEGWEANTFSFQLNVAENAPPTFTTPDVYKCKIGEQQTILITDISDGDAAAKQDIGFSLTSTNDDVLDSEDYEIIYTQDAPTAQLQFTPTASGNSTVSLTLNDGQLTNNSTTKPFTVTAFDDWNDNPTLDQIASFMVYNNAGEQTIVLSGISDGNNDTQELTFEVNSSDQSIIPTPTVQYASGNTGTLTYTPQPGQTGTVTITVTVTDDGGAIDNNGNGSITHTFTIDVQSPPLTGFTIPLTDYEGDRANGLWSVEGDTVAQTIAYEKNGTDDVLYINCTGKSTWTGLWYYFNDPMLDLEQNPYITMSVKSDQDINFRLYFWDYENQRNMLAPVENRAIPANEWTEVSFDFYGKMANSNAEPINADKIESLLLNYHPTFGYPFTGWTGKVWIKDIRIGDQADGDFSHPSICTINDIANLTFYSDVTTGSVELSNITDGNNGTAAATAISGNTNVAAHPTISAVTDGKATLSYTLTGTPGNATITVTVSADGSTQTTKSFNINVQEANPETTSTVTIDLNTKHQTMRGIGTYVDTGVKPYLKNYTEELGATVARFGVIGNQIEPVNDNNDPYVLDRSALDYSAFDWDFIKDLKSNGVEHFILSIWSMPAWMKVNASENYFIAQAVAWENTTNKVDTTMYEEYAENIVAIIKAFKEKADVDLYAIGLQNEPAFNEPYASAILSPELFVKLINIVGRRFEHEGINCRLYMAEQVLQQSFYSWTQYLAALQNDPEAWKYCDINAVHGYAGDGITAYEANCSQWTSHSALAKTAPHPKEFWMTETEPASATWANIMSNVGAMNTAFTCGDVSLWAQWNYKGHFTLLGESNQLAYAQSQFAKFVKPGAVRVSATTSDENLLVSSFVNTIEHGGKLATVVINKGTSPVSIKLTGEDIPETLDTYQTYYLKNFKEIKNGAQKDVAYLLPAQSITTFVAPLPNLAPTIDPVADQIVEKNSGTHEVILTGISDGDEGDQTITITPTIESGNDIISNVYIDYNSPESTAKLYFTVEDDKTGNASIKIEVVDDGVVNNTTTVYCNVNVVSETSVNPVKKAELTIYPTPAESYITISLPNSTYTSLTIINTTGQIVGTQTISSEIEQINVDNLKAGVYFIRVENEDGDVLTKRFIKK